MTFQGGAGRRAIFNHRLGPVEVLFASLQAPIGRRRVSHIENVRYFVDQLYQNRFGGEAPRMLDLQPFSLRLRQALVVGHLFNDSSDAASEGRFKFIGDCYGILKGVVEYGGGESFGVADAADFGEQQ